MCPLALIQDFLLSAWDRQDFSPGRNHLQFITGSLGQNVNSLMLRDGLSITKSVDMMSKKHSS